MPTPQHYNGGGPPRGLINSQKHQQQQQRWCDCQSWTGVRDEASLAGSLMPIGTGCIRSMPLLSATVTANSWHGGVGMWRGNTACELAASSIRAPSQVIRTSAAVSPASVTFNVTTTILSLCPCRLWNFECPKPLTLPAGDAPCFRYCKMLNIFNL